MENPYSPPQFDDFSIGNQQDTPRRYYGGIGRLAYVGAGFAIGFMQNIVLLGLSEAPEPGLVAIVLLGFLVLHFVPIYYRVKNIGMNPWWCLLMLVPIINILLAVRCLVCQEGFQDTKKLDTAGKVITFIFVGFLVLLVGLVVFAIIAG